MHTHMNFSAIWMRTVSVWRSTSEKLGYRVRAAQVEKVPYLIILGKNEVKDGTVSYRLHGEQATTTVPKEEFLAMLKDEIVTKKINPAALK